MIEPMDDTTQVFIEYLEATGQMSDFQEWIWRHKQLDLSDLGIDVWEDDDE